MEKRMSYSIDNVLNFIVIDRTKFTNRIFNTFDKHYENFVSSHDLEDCDLIIEIGKFKPNLDNSYNVGDGKYYFQEEYMYISKEQYKGAKWKFEINGLNSSQTTVKIDCNTLGRIFITGNVIDFLIHLKLLQKGYTIIHASAVANGENAFIFSGRGGGGKTTIALEMITQGLSLLGDNYLILNKGEAIAFPTSLSIFNYNLAPIISKSISSKEKIELKIKSALYKLSGGYAKFFTKVNPKRISDLISSSKIKQVFLIIPSTRSLNTPITVEDIRYQDLIAQMKYNLMLEFPFFNKYIEEYSYLFPQSYFSLHWDKYTESLIDNLPNTVKYSKIIVPTTYNKSIFSKIAKMANSD